ncbi:MAG TPA: dCTP deaminase [Candidatus Paceibacterota bacterium]
MYLSDTDIIKSVKSGDIVIRGFDIKRLQPASYDIQLGNIFQVILGHGSLAIDPVKKIYPKMVEKKVKDGQEYYLHPGGTVLGTSKDYFGSDKYLIHLSGKSSLARLGLVVHNTAGLINPGHFLNITFELSNTGRLPIILRPRMAIAQVTFAALSSPPRKDYKTTGRYYGRDWEHFTDPKELKSKKHK